jgi:hypothetical protein
MARTTSRGLNIVMAPEIPSGTVDGTNAVFTLSSTPYSPTAVLVFVDGLAQPPANYSVSGTSLTFVTPPAASQDVMAWYIRKN